RTEWRVLFHLGCYGEMTAKDICVRARLHKTKVSRAVAALQTRRFLTRRELERDRRHAVLQLTALGQKVFADLSRAAHAFDLKARAAMTPDEAEILHRCLIRIAGFETAQRTG
ncbi:MAG: MarR family transcriptional regulator, partial [Boseongicola sp.]|nr:MarR family transcriptional regulator [Boseongicola sp.]